MFNKQGCSKEVTCTKSRQALINLKTDEGEIKLKKEKKETNLSQFKKLLKLIVPGIEIEYVKASLDNLRSIEMKRAEKLYEEQERRVDEFVKKCDCEDDMEIEEAWQNYLEEHLQFPFEAEIVDEKQKEIFPYLNCIEKTLREQSFSGKRSGNEYIKRILAVCFEQNLTTEKFEDFDRERWVILGD